MYFRILLSPLIDSLLAGLFSCFVENKITDNKGGACWHQLVLIYALLLSTRLCEQLHFIIEWLFCCESVDGFKDPYAASIGLATHHPKRLQDKLPPIPAMNFYGGKNSDSSRCFNRIPSNKKKAGLKGFMFNQVELTSPFLFFYESLLLLFS